MPTSSVGCVASDRARRCCKDFAPQGFSSHAALTTMSGDYVLSLNRMFSETSALLTRRLPGSMESWWRTIIGISANQGDQDCSLKEAH